MDEKMTVEEKKRLTKKWDKGFFIVLIVAVMIGLIISPLVNYQDDKITTEKVEILSLIPFQLSCILMLYVTYVCYRLGAVVGKATCKRVSYNRKFPVTWDYNWSLYIIIFTYLFTLFLTVNYSVYPYFRTWEFTEEGYRVVYLLPYSLIYLLVIQVALIGTSWMAFWGGYSMELMGKELPEKRPYRVRDMWYELLGWNGRVKYHPQPVKPINTKKQIVILAGVIIITVIAFLLDLLGVY